jgi:acetyltransferase-like isoleucine patch superfamily enzyme
MKERTRHRLQFRLARLERTIATVMEIRAGDSLAAQFAEFGESSRIAWPRILIQNPSSVAVGDDVEIRSHLCIEALAPPGKVVLRIGSGSIIGHNVRFVAMNGIVLEEGCGIGHGVTVADSVHDWRSVADDEPPWRSGFVEGPPLRVESGAWIGNNSLVLGSITIGRRAIIAPHSVVTRDVPPNTMVSGNPGRRVPFAD